MNDDGVTEHCGHVKTDLLAESQSVDIDGIEAALGTCSSREEQGVNIVYVADGADESGEEEGHADDVQVVDGDEVELPLGEQIGNLCLEEVSHISPGLEGHVAGE